MARWRSMPIEKRRWLRRDMLRALPWFAGGLAAYAFVIFGSNQWNGTVRWLAFFSPVLLMPIVMAAQALLRRHPAAKSLAEGWLGDTRRRNTLLVVSLLLFIVSSLAKTFS